MGGGGSMCVCVCVCIYIWVGMCLLGVCRVWGVPGVGGEAPLEGSVPVKYVLVLHLSRQTVMVINAVVVAAAVVVVVARRLVCRSCGR